MKRTKFSSGRRWALKPERARYGQFDFVILGPPLCEDLNPTRYKLCRLEYKDHHNPGHGMTQDYSHEHLKACADLLEEEST